MSTFKNIGFVTIQLILFGFYYFDLIEFDLIDQLIFLSPLFLTLTILGVTIIVIAMLQLNTHLSPFPKPKKNSQLIQNGLYKYVRHPIYTGLIISIFSYSLYIQSPWKLLISILLYILFEFKARYEEKLLTNKFCQYEAYIKSNGRFFPTLLK